MTLLGWTCKYGGSDLNAESSLVRLADVMATRKAVLRENSFSLQVAIGSNGGLVRALRSSRSDYCDTGCCKDGLMFCNPFRNLLTVGWEKSLVELE